MFMIYVLYRRFLKIIRVFGAVDSADEEVTKCHIRGEVASEPTLKLNKGVWRSW